MPITINGTGSITGISAGGIPDGCVDTDVLANNAVTYAKIGTTEQGQLCKAWVNFNGTGTVAIRASYNVSSITDNGVGSYTVNFSTALADANYTTVASTNNYQALVSFDGATATASAKAVIARQSNAPATAQDVTEVSVAIFR